MDSKELQKNVSNLQWLVAVKLILSALHDGWVSSRTMHDSLPEMAQLLTLSEAAGREQRRINHLIDEAGMSAAADKLYRPFYGADNVPATLVSQLTATNSAKTKEKTR